MLQFLKELICYLGKWRATVEGRPGFNDDQRQHMLLSAATDNGIRITDMWACFICIGAYTYILPYSEVIGIDSSWNACVHFLSEKPENYFGRRQSQ